ncbi:hypothetical protein [Dactylosporangium cerinum]
MSSWSRYRRLVGAELFKLRTVRRWVIVLIALIPLTAGFALLLSSTFKYSPGVCPRSSDRTAWRCRTSSGSCTSR